MPYSVSAPPEAIKGLPKHAQEIFIAAFNSAHEQYKDEGRSMATAWAAVKTKYKQLGDTWVAKESSGVSILAELIKEADACGVVDDPRIKKLVALDELDQEHLTLARTTLAQLRESRVDHSKESTRTIVQDYVPLTEAEISSKGTASVVVLRPGFNSSKQRYYAHDTIARDYKVFEGAKMYADHPTEQDEKLRPERSIKDWVATLKNVKVNNRNEIIGEAVIVEPWMQEKLTALKDKGLLNEMGISINAIGQATKQTIDGVSTAFIEKIVRARSVDFVTEAGAGGQVEIFESGNDFDVDVISLDTLKERRPDLVITIEEAAKQKTKQEDKHLEIEEKVKTLESTNETLVKENGDLKALITEAGKKEAISKTQAAVKEAVDKTTLPAPAKARVIAKFSTASEITGLEEAIKEEQDYIAAITEAGKVKGMGGGPAGDPEATKKALVESVKRLNPTWNEKQVQTFIDGR